ncbi:class I adenylate-forming enzyme family protein [Streptomyces europaeiscabiei]|uniref:AMP-binding protein n=1 Tax=Streptomyces europaeiscabiei TaxID=146819 RepID=A0ABU4NH34_9ACTN|nr:AMP-binding protein [Streptomyces europaeiscabiei]MDX2522666.1 AMP-binding protein [Streptomyces europaeiscabiei]MDX2763548.1 AMP-binding protein [Streptomyces europaeiscabiei]MDX3544514.1 AMP-binding protein [Streptomyces europaeiscabiei]MDX3553863.1 AMP-binding protein [Streptomyces europaeiscabiei]MDX3670147.1 AMP-binding protein [Streptomyces europaeiscabiei]
MNETAHALSESRTLWELLVRRAELTPDRPVLLQDDRTLSFGELRTRAERVAAGLYDMGVRPGTVVAWQLPTRIETALLSFALARLGAVQSPVIPFYRDREVGFALRESKADFFAVPGEWRGFDHTQMARRLEARGIFEAYDRLPDGDPAALPAPPADGTSVRWIYWTSGTTSDPKGVLHTDRSLIAGGSCLAHALRLSQEDVGSIAFPYAHIGGPDYMVMLLLYGFPAVMFEHFALPAALEGYRKHGVTVAGGSTAFYSMFLAEQRKQPGVPVVPTLRLLAGGGAPKPPEVYHSVVREMGVQLTHGYGMTEVPMITMGAPDDSVENLATTEGRPPAGMEIRIAEDGEVRLRGEAVCRGYLDPAQSAAAFDTDGFFVTGDLGQVTDSGHLVLTGRLKDVIIRKGENISAKEIEDLLHRHPAVQDAAVIGLPDAERGERVCAVVEQPPGADPLTLTDVTDWLRAEGLSVHKLPEQVEVVDALPRNETLRKVLKYKLRERYS